MSTEKASQKAAGPRVTLGALHSRPGLSQPTAPDCGMAPPGSLKRLVKTQGSAGSRQARHEMQFSTCL